MILPYSKIPSIKKSGGPNLRPMAVTILHGPKGSWEGPALIDSGADLSIFDLRIANSLGLDLSLATTVSLGGIGKGNLRVLIVNVTLQIRGLEKKVRIPLGLVVSPTTPNLLGQEGFFDNFVIKFDRAHDIIEIT